MYMPKVYIYTYVTDMPKVIYIIHIYILYICNLYIYTYIHLYECTYIYQHYWQVQRCSE